MRSPSRSDYAIHFTTQYSWAWSATVRPVVRGDAQERKGHVRPALQSTRLLPWAGIACVRVDSSTRGTMMTFDSIDVSFYPPIPTRKPLSASSPPVIPHDAIATDGPVASARCKRWCFRRAAVRADGAARSGSSSSRCRHALIGTCVDGPCALGSFNEAEFLDIVFAVRSLRAPSTGKSRQLPHLDADAAERWKA
jgi:hypothetical protein